MGLRNEAITAVTLLFLSLWLPLSAHAAGLRGTVKSEKGDPLANVQILTYAPLRQKEKFLGMQMTTKRHETTTDENGRFTLPDHGQIVYFKRHDLIPVTKILKLSATLAEIVMKDASSTTREIPACSAVPNPALRVGLVFKVAPTEDVLTRKWRGPESDVFLFGFDTGGGKFETMVSSGGSTSIEPTEELLLNSKEFSERLWRSGKTLGYEIRGITADGKVWRRLSFPWGAIAYQGNSEKAARAFDRLLENVCFDESSINN